MPRVKQFDETEVLEKAMNFFWHKGYNGTSPQEILDELGLSRSSLYDTFGDKRTLFIKTLKYYRQHVTAAVINTLDTSTDIMATLQLLFDQTKESCHAASEGRGCFMVNTGIELALHDEEVAAITQENKQALENAFTRAIKKAQANGQITSTHPPRSLATFILNTLWGLSAYSKVENNSKTFDNIIKIALTNVQ